MWLDHFLFRTVHALRVERKSTVCRIFNWKLPVPSFQFPGIRWRPPAASFTGDWEPETGNCSLTLSGTIRRRRFAAAARQTPQYLRTVAAPKRRWARRRDPRQHKQELLISNSLKFPGGHRRGVTPVPIPNTEVKLSTADGTAWVTVWESRSLPGLFLQGPL